MHAASSTTEPQFYPPTAPWVVRDNEIRLCASRCRTCETVLFPAPPVCHACGGDTFDTVELSPRGKLYTFTEIATAPKEFATPYVVGYVDMPEGVRVFGQVENRAADLRVDQEVEVVIGQVRSSPSGAPVLSYKFRSTSRD